MGNKEAHWKRGGSWERGGPHSCEELNLALAVSPIHACCFPLCSDPFTMWRSLLCSVGWISSAFLSEDPLVHSGV